MIIVVTARGFVNGLTMCIEATMRTSKIFIVNTTSVLIHGGAIVSSIASSTVNIIVSTTISITGVIPTIVGTIVDGTVDGLKENIVAGITSHGIIIIAIINAAELTVRRAIMAKVLLISILGGGNDLPLMRDCAGSEKEQ
jgi:hypothetical protein